MAGGDRSTADHVLLAELVKGTTILEAAKVAGVSEATVYRRLRDNEFRTSLADARRELVEATVMQLAAAGPKAVATLVSLLEEGTPPAVRRNAAKDVLAALTELGAVPDLAARFEAVEQALGIAGNGARR